MASTSKIEWTEQTWNPIVGCSIISPGCTNCYAMRDAWRKHHNPITPHYHGLTRKVNGSPVWTGKLAIASDAAIELPQKRKKPTTYFVNSMGDLFHEDAPRAWIDRCFAVMEAAPQHTFQILTKRPHVMLGYVSDRKPHPHIWLGTSAEDQRRYDERQGYLGEIAKSGWLTFISAEPLLGPIELTGAKPDWLIAGAESGRGSRPCDLNWVRSLRDQCSASNIAFFFKQHAENGRKISLPELDGRSWTELPDNRKAA
jgi:protein gp37